MATYKPSNSIVFQQFFSPVTEVYSKSEKQYRCISITDLDFLEMGVLRCLSNSQTGREFIQHHGDHDRLDVETDPFFKALKSKRRVANLQSINRLIKPIVKSRINDPFKSIPELDSFALYAADGHFHAGAVHDEKRSTEKGGERKPATSHFYMTDLRTHFMTHLGTSDLTNGRKGEHDMHLIKRSDMQELRGHTPKGTKVILVWDKAGIDFRFWHNAKTTSGLYFISREKENMKLIRCGTIKVDYDDPRNAGVISDEQVGPGGSGAMLRRIVYQDPGSEEIYTYITTEMTLPPGIICLLYKHRWDIEKIYDEFKNKLMEKKSWGSGDGSKTANALFLCLTHNLLLLIEATVTEEGITNDPELERKKGRLEKAENAGTNFVASFIQRFTVRSVKFIRWLRSFVYREAPWSRAKARLAKVYADT
ncbi:MAG: transposase [Verrucomicrobiales bacterium]|nr:transposase [Verrucomicrobiales bacterium]